MKKNIDRIIFLPHFLLLFLPLTFKIGIMGARNPVKQDGSGCRLNRKNLINSSQHLLFIIFFLASILVPCQAWATIHLKSNQTPNIVKSFLNEELAYTVGFWKFENIAFCKISLRKDKNGEYLAVLSTYTTGNIDQHLIHRRDLYVEHLQLINGGRRFITKRIEKLVNLNGKLTRSVISIDRKKMTMEWKSMKSNMEMRSGKDILPANINCDGPLSAFYNFRFGAYGPLEEGREYRINLLPKKGNVPSVYMRFSKMTAKEQDRAAYIVNAKMGKELFGSQPGDIDIYFTAGMVPLKIVAKNVLHFGDIIGKLVQKGSPTR